MKDADTGIAGDLSGEGLRIAIVRARFNDAITSKLAQACTSELERLDVDPGDIKQVTVPGALEIAVVLKALELGAVDFITKPGIGVSDGLTDLSHEIGDKIRAASRAHIRRHALNATQVTRPQPLPGHFLHTTEKIVFVGSSTGGTEALKEFLTRMPATSPAVLITQHMPEAFTRSFAQRLDGLPGRGLDERPERRRLAGPQPARACFSSATLRCAKGISGQSKNRAAAARHPCERASIRAWVNCPARACPTARSPR